MLEEQKSRLIQNGASASNIAGAEIRLAYLVTHPIQYQAPLLKRIAKEPDIRLKAFFASDLSIGSFSDSGFNTTIRWDIPLLDGYDYEFLPGLGRKDRLSFWQPLSCGFARRLREGRFDTLWVHGYMRWSHLVAMLAAKRLKMKVLVRDEATRISARRGPLKRLVKRAFFNGLGRLADRFLAIGILNAEYYALNGIDRERIIRVPYAVDNAFFQAAAARSSRRRDEFRRSLDLMDERPVILYAGKMTGRKRPDDLLKAYTFLSPDGRAEPNPYLIFVGDGDLRTSLEQRARELGWESIIFAGFRNQSELSAFYDLCDLFVIPSMAEPWGLVVNEVMNAGKAVIASDQVGCAPDLVRDGYNGAVFRAGDVTDLHRVLKMALADRERLALMGQRSLEIINRLSFEEDVLGLRMAIEGART